MIVFLNGRFIDAGKAKISVFDHGFLFGDGVYETLRTYSGKIWQMREHLLRLRHSAGLLGIPVPWTGKQISQWVYKVVRLNKFRESRIRITLTRGENYYDFIGAKKPTLCIQVSKLIPEPESVYKDGVKTISFPMTRLLPEAKSINLLPMILAQRAMQKRHAYEAMFVDTKKYVREGTITNVFIVKGCILTTPKTGVLSGMTREAVVHVAVKLGFKVIFKDFTLRRLVNSDEVFITNSPRGIIPVVQIDGHRIASGKPGPSTILLMKSFDEYIRKNLT